MVSDWWRGSEVMGVEATDASRTIGRSFADGPPIEWLMDRQPQCLSTDMSRRTLLRRGLVAAGGVSLSSVLSACNVPLLSSSEPAPEFPVEGPEEALQRLMEGNQRYAAGASKPVNESAERRVKVAERQRPFAAVLSCVDSRVPPELIFDRGLGDLLVVRTAGHVVDSAVLGSLEYGAYELEIPLLLVLGHQKCGAMQATMDAVKSGAKVDGGIAYLVDALRPAVVGEKPAETAPTHAESADPLIGSSPATADISLAAETVADSAVDTSVDTSATDTSGDGGEGGDGGDGTKVDALTAAIKRNVTMTVAKVSASPIIAERIRKDRLRVVGAFYDLETGLVELTDNIPKQFLPTDGSADTTA